MTIAANLLEASELSFAQISILWNANAATMSAAYLAFINDCKPIFSDASVNDRIVRNWLVPMLSLYTSMTEENPSARLPLTIFSSAVEYVTRMTASASAVGLKGLITNAQATALLVAWNARFGT